MTVDTILAPLLGQFMETQVEYGAFYRVECDDGSSGLVPADVVGDVLTADLTAFVDYVERVPVSVERVTGWAARLSAPGYMDCTEWDGVYDTAEEAAAALVEAYGE